jgi:DNA polymerase III delta prime subunit
MNKQMEDEIWVEKYRPLDINDVVMEDRDKQKITEFINNPSKMPNLLFYGPPGTGKCHGGEERIEIIRIDKDQGGVITNEVIEFKKLYERYTNQTNQIYNEIIPVEDDIKVLTDTGRYTPVLGVIKKRSKTLKVIVETNILTGESILLVHIASDEHLFVDIHGKMVKTKDLKPGMELLFRQPQTGLGRVTVKNIELNSQSDEVYDISIPFPHLYCTNDGLIHHNTTTAKILTNYILQSREDLLSINGSSNTGVSMYRENVEEFVKMPPYNSPIRIVHIEECDYLSKNAQATLRATMEAYYKNARYLMTANYPHKLLDPLRSRTIQFKFEKMPRNFLYNHCKKILDNENIGYRENDLNMIIDITYPDIRETVMILQKLTSDNKINIDALQDVIRDEIFLYEKFKEFNKNIKNKDNNNINTNMNDIMGYLKNDKDVQLEKVYENIFKDDTILIPFKILTNKYYGYLKNNANTFMNFMSYVYECYSLYKKGIII